MKRYIIVYDYMQEAWVKATLDGWIIEDSGFMVSMTPEGASEELEQTFNSEKEFYKWYDA